MNVIAAASTSPSSLPRTRSTHFLTSGVAEVAPDFARMAIEFAFGDLYSRDALDLQKPRADRDRRAGRHAGTPDRSCASMSQPQRSSASRESEIVEVLMQTALYARLPGGAQRVSRLP